MRKLIPYALLLAEVLLFHRYVLFYPDYVFPWDIRYFHYPHAFFMAESLRHGQLPLWDPYTYFGRPFQANIQTGVFYPPVVLVILLSNWIGGHLFYLLECGVVFHIFLAGVFAFWLLRRLGASQPAALLGATVYQLGGFFAAHVEHMGAVSVAAWIPLAWLAVLSLRDSLRWLPVLALALSMAVLAGLTPLTAVVFASSLLLALLLAVYRQASWRLPALVLIASVWALLLAAVQLFPTAELSLASVAQYRGDWLKSGGGVPLEALVSLVWPDHYHIFDLSRYSFRWELTFMYLYCGIPGLILAVLAVLRRRHRQAGLWAVMTLLLGIAMLGDSTPIGRSLYFLLPPSIRNGLHPEYTLPAFILGMAMLAGLGAHHFLRKRRRLAYPLVAFAALDLILVSSGRPMNRASLRQEPGVTHNSMHGSALDVQRMRLLADRTFPPARIDSLDATQDWAMSAPLLELPSANGNDPMALSRAIQVRLAFCQGERWGTYYQVSGSKLDSPVLGLVNLRYLLSAKPVAPAVLERAGFAEVALLRAGHVYENQGVLPRFFLVGRIRRAAGMQEAVGWLHSREFNPRSEAVVEGPAELPGGTGAAPGQVRVLEYQPRQVVLEVDSPAPAFLVTSETHYPGWRAFIDGREWPIYYTNVAFRGLAVPAGRHRVLMRFSPTLLRRSAAVSALAWLSLLGFAAARGTLTRAVRFR